MSATLGNGTVTFGDSTVQSTAATGGGTKAWAQFSQNLGTGAITINGSYNISSITRSAAGHFTVNFTTALANANYCVVGNVGSSATHGYGDIFNPFTTGGVKNAPTTSSFTINVVDPGNADVDVDYCCFAVFN